MEDGGVIRLEPIGGSRRGAPFASTRRIVMRGTGEITMLICLGLVASSCMSPESLEHDTEKMSPFQSSGFPVASDLDSNEPSHSAQDVASDTMGNGLQQDAVNADAVELGDSSPYECEPFIEEECVNQCGHLGIRKCIKEWGPCVVIDVCNGIDDDCNGVVDDGPDGGPIDEICDGLDNDCDGEVDEGLFQDCGCHGVTSSKVACINGQYPACPEPQSATLMVHIPELYPNCPFGIDDNWEKTGGKAAARVEQDIPFSFPEDQLICSLALSGASDDFYYDDTMVLALNGVVLISSTAILDKFQMMDGLPMYAWDALVGESIGKEGPECLAGATACQMPGTQQNGEVSLAFDPITSEQLIQTGQGVDHTFTAIVTGDDNPPIDCHHTGLTILVDYTYVPKE